MKVLITVEFSKESLASIKAEGVSHDELATAIREGFDEANDDGMFDGDTWTVKIEEE